MKRKYKISIETLKENTWGNLEGRFYVELQQLIDSFNAFNPLHLMPGKIDSLISEATAWTNKNHRGKCELEAVNKGDTIVIHRHKEPGQVLFRVLVSQIDL